MKIEFIKRVLSAVLIMLTVLFTCLRTGTLSAQASGTNTVVDELQAQTVALNFFKGNTQSLSPGAALTASLIYTQTAVNGTVLFYVFDINPVQGFVIVSGNRNVIPVLAYSTEKHFNSAFGRNGVNSWVNRTSANIYNALQHNAQADTRIDHLWSAYTQGINPVSSRSTPVHPMLTTQWDQENYGTPPPFLYNLYCPYNATDGQRCLVGCVATAMAQIMKYWNFPSRGTGSFSYVDNVANGYTNNYGTISANFGASPYDWANMTDTITVNSSGVTDTAVDLVMYQCAVSVAMDFGDDNQNGSGAEALQSWAGAGQACSEYAFSHFFYYDSTTIQGINDSFFTNSAWLAAIEGELTAGRPVLYEGNDSLGDGHAWVCDGVDANDMLHMNWGWSGTDDGFFAINNFTTTGGYSPIYQQAALIGIKPGAVVTGVKTAADELVWNVYPNPAMNEIWIQAGKLEQESVLELKNILGQSLITKNIADVNTRIDLSGYAPGFYLLQLTQGEKVSVKKIVVSR